MSETTREAVVREVEALLTAFGHAADTRNSDALAALFLADGVLQAGQQTISGRITIAAFNAARFAAASTRTTRHIWSNLRVETSVDEVLHAFSIQQTFDQGEPGALADLRVSDLHDVFRREVDGRLRFASRSIQRVFAQP